MPEPTTPTIEELIAVCDRAINTDDLSAMHEHVLHEKFRNTFNPALRPRAAGAQAAKEEA